MAKNRRTALPTKPCKMCGRAFTWRRKWQRCWDEVKYCSERCRRQGKSASKADS
ncbi:MAG: DUF2256 domain-containing protein [Planctomycetaceae bacterium TMED240]|nr:DUF2256 domain-containing protein [Rhodopirellula sp.]OUX05287.1 MAG: DUF2256 domain-containing protein [Planctomycetaceae bacterium TMED240]